MSRIEVAPTSAIASSTALVLFFFGSVWLAAKTFDYADFFTLSGRLGQSRPPLHRRGTDSIRFRHCCLKIAEHFLHRQTPATRLHPARAAMSLSLIAALIAARSRKALGRLVLHCLFQWLPKCPSPQLTITIVFSDPKGN